MMKIFEYLKRHERTGMKENLYDIVQAEFNEFETILSPFWVHFKPEFDNFLIKFQFYHIKNDHFYEILTFEIFKWFQNVRLYGQI